MSKNKLVIDLIRITLTDKQRKDLHDAIQKTVAKQLKKVGISGEKEVKAKPGSKSATLKGAKAAPMTANLAVIFINTNPGLSKLTAIFNEKKQTIDRSGTI